MKQIGLAARIYSNDHNGVFPPDFQAMANELASPQILCCPADTAKSKATSWSDLSPANVSYDYLLPSAKEDDVMRKVVFRCPIHGHLGYGDGSVTQGDQKE